jgi:hypothetical protein
VHTDEAVTVGLAPRLDGLVLHVQAVALLRLPVGADPLVRNQSHTDSIGVPDLHCQLYVKRCDSTLSDAAWS